MPAGSLFGALLVSSLADWIGRKKTIMVSGWIWVIGSILQCAAVVGVNFSVAHLIGSDGLHFAPGSGHARSRTRCMRNLGWDGIYDDSALSI